MRLKEWSNNRICKTYFLEIFKRFQRHNERAVGQDARESAKLIVERLLWLVTFSNTSVDFYRGHRICVSGLIAAPIRCRYAVKLLDTAPNTGRLSLPQSYPRSNLLSRHPVYAWVCDDETCWKTFSENYKTYLGEQK
jgi:hypothetical protein